MGGDPKVRSDEFVRAMNYLKFEYKILNFPDRRLIMTRFSKMVEVVDKIVDDNKISMLVGFSPYEITRGFDHTDHNRSGEVVRQVSVAMKGKRKLWLWTSKGKPVLSQKRSDYVKRYYPSQQISFDILKQLGESYIKVR